MKGRSSLGFLRYAALVRIEENGKRRLALVDLKEAGPGCAGRLEVRLRMWALCPCAHAV